MKWLLLVLGFVWLALVPVPALAQASQGGSSAQYDQYGLPGSAVGGRAAQDAIVATGAIRATSQDAQASERNAASAAETPDESTNTSGLKELPETSGPSPLWFGVPLVCAGVLLARRILFPQ